MNEPLIACVCPTYKRPELLRNAIACFESQTYENRLLFVLDDAGQHDNQSGNRWFIDSTIERLPDLPAKFNALIEIANGFGPDIISVWEDDDIYLPHHLELVANSWSGGVQFFAPLSVLTTYDVPFGEVRTEGASGRFHGSWAYSVGLIELLGGYPQTDRLDFDQQMHGRAKRHDLTHYDIQRKTPSYVYRWGNGVYHGSQAGEGGFRSLWDDLGRRPAEYIGATSAKFDAETEIIYRSHGFPIHIGTIS